MMDRLERYFQDYWFGWAEEKLEEVGISTSNMTQKEIYDLYKKHINPKGDEYIDAYFDASLIDWGDPSNYE